MTKYLLNVDGHQATLQLNSVGNDGSVIGTISTAEFGGGAFIGTETGVALTGKVTLDGHTASVGAMISGKAIAGKISVGIFWSKNFSGVEVD